MYIYPYAPATAGLKPEGEYVYVCCVWVYLTLRVPNPAGA